LFNYLEPLYPKNNTGNYLLYIDYGLCFYIINNFLLKKYEGVKRMIENNLIEDSSNCGMFR
jgi:hypothetical protein